MSPLVLHKADTILLCCNICAQLDCREKGLAGPVDLVCSGLGINAGEGTRDPAMAVIRVLGYEF